MKAWKHESVYPRYEGLVCERIAGLPDRDEGSRFLARRRRVGEKCVIDRGRFLALLSWDSHGRVMHKCLDSFSQIKAPIPRLD